MSAGSGRTIEPEEPRSRRTIDPEEPRSRTPGVWGGKQTQCLLLDSQEHFGPSPVSARRRTSANSSMI